MQRRRPLRLAAALAFPGVGAVGVTPAGPRDADALSALVRAAGGDPRGYRAHLTVARTSHRSDALPADGPLAGFTGSWWRPSEVCLVRSDLASGAPRYTVLHRVALRSSDTRAARCQGRR